MKIVISTAVYYPQINGVAVFSHNLADGLVKRGHEVLVLCPSLTGKNHTENQAGVMVHYLRSMEAKVYPDQIHDVPKKRWPLYRHGFRVSIFPQIEIKKILTEFKPDVVHVQVSDPIGLSVVGWARHNSVPIVTTEHNQPEVLTEPLRIPKVMRRGANAALSAYFRNRQSKSDFVTMPTERAIRVLLEKHPIDVPVAAVSNGVDLSHFKPGKASDEIYKKYGIKKNVPTILYIGRVDPEKKVGLVLEAAKKARKRFPTMEVVIVGDGIDKTKLERIYGQEPWVHFLGKVLAPDLYELYRVGWVFVTASEIETQGIVLIEAAASGLPLIAVDKGAVSEICINNKNGLLCKPGSVDEIAKSIQRILNDEELRTKFSKESIRIASEHDFEKTLDRFINVYHKVINSKTDND